MLSKSLAIHHALLLAKRYTVASAIREVTLSVIITSGFVSAALGQTLPSSQPPDQKQENATPHDLYKQAMRPLDIVRQSIDNWSEPELAAFDVVKQKAKESCSKSDPEEYSRDDLYDLVSLCALGQDWHTTNVAALRYLASGEQKYRTHAYAMSMEAQVRLQDATGAIQTAEKMLHEQPYDAVVAQSFWFLITYLDTNFDLRAIDVASDQQPFLLEALKKHEALKDPKGDGSIEIGNLYQEGMQLAFLQRYQNLNEKAAETVKELKDALSSPQPLSFSDLQTIEKTDIRYSLLGRKLPPISVSASLLGPKAKAAVVQDPGAFTVLAIFPEWCAQCAKMMKDTPEGVSINSNNISVKYNQYGLLLPNKGKEENQPLEEHFKTLLHTPTLLTTNDTFEKFGATDYPLGIVADKSGIIRFVGVLPPNAMQYGSYVFRKIAQIAFESSNRNYHADHTSTR